MLRADSEGRMHAPSHPPSSPIRRLVHPVTAIDDHEDDVSISDAEFVSSVPAPSHEGGRIRREAFSPNYFNTFFTEERELGRGGKGVVLLVKHHIDGCSLGYFACKRVPVGDDHAWLEKVLVEVELLAKLSHPNLVSYRHVWLEDMKLNRFGPSVACAFILQQYCNGGDLHHYVIGDVPKEATKEELKAQMRRRSKGQADRPRDLFAGHRRMPFDEIYSLFKDITSGLAYLHGTNYIHRDLKPSNCLLHRERGQLACLISDFGEVQAENAVRMSTGSTGTISYCAPEVLKKDSTGRYGNFTAKSDIFSLGMILYFMCFGRLPYRAANSVHEELEDIDQLRAEITDWTGFQDERRERPDLPSKVYQLLKKLLAVNPGERPTANEVLAAMKNESSLDGVARTRSSSPPIGLGARRIQSLDSPVPPSTPVPDPSKHARVTSTLEEELSASLDGNPSPPMTQGTLQKHAVLRSRQSHSRSLPTPDGQVGYSRSGSHSPERSLDIHTAALKDASPSSSSLPSPSIHSTPLLMAPPTTRLGQIQHYGTVLQYRAQQSMQKNADLLGSFFRLVMFGIKLVSLSWICWPYTFRTGILTTLFGLAALDLWNPMAGALNPSYLNGSREGRTMARPGSHWSLASAMRQWSASWWQSSSLFALHFFIVWVTSRYGALCAGGASEKWPDW
ncbi:IKS protein kinase [Rhypophila decipiens]